MNLSGNLSVREFLKVFIPIFVSFVTFRVITQTDVIMVSYLGELETAAFSIPSRIMLFDTIAAFAIGPVISVIVAGAKSEAQRKKTIQNSLSFAIGIGFLLMILGLIIYPTLVAFISKKPEIVRLATQAVFWLTVAIPLRLGHFVGTMILNGSRRGHQIIPLNCFTIVLNALLNWLLIFKCQMGFSGCYLATSLTSIVQFGWVLFLLRRDIVGISRIIPDRRWVKHLLRHVGAEWIRLLSWQTIGFLTLMLFAKEGGQLFRLSAYSVAIEFQILILMPFIAVMRSSAILFSSYQEWEGKQFYEASKKLALCGALFLFPFVILLILASDFLGGSLYHLRSEALQWWSPYIFITALLLPLYYLDAIQRGIWQSKRRFGIILLAELVSDWFFALPIVYLGLRWNSPWFTWSYLAVSRLIFSAILFSLRERLKISSEVSDAALDMTIVKSAGEAR